ncbi:uncharacterized protein LOC124364323 [Homalodisca vitripennis]|uniref:uncharacterized protein LOC124364323 n=1 Tax=Homalodisca vitripennis TaxID=197043 RepID=UPI001EEA57AA|nr:uncharacterized protein LOC124364323 [Homalodisca vitripennis]
MVVGCAYIPPNRPSTDYLDFCQTADQLFGFRNDSVDQILLMGDFNLPHTDWHGGRRGVGDSSRFVMDLASSYDLKQYNSVPNFRGVVLDLVFSSNPVTVVTPASDLLLPEDRHHPALDIVISVKQSAHLKNVKYIPDFRNCDLVEIFRLLQGVDLPIDCALCDAEQMFNAFCDQLSSAVSRNTPIKRIESSKFPKWFTNELKNLVINKKTAHRKFKMTGDPFYLECFRKLRRECKIKTSDCYRVYIGKVEEGIPHNIKSFWSHVQDLKSSSALPAMHLNGNTADDPTEKCNLFARHFSSVFCDTDIAVPHFDFGWNDSLSSIVLSATDVQAKLEVLDPFKSAGPDGIPPCVLRFCAPVLASHLAVLFNLLLASGTFPSVLRRGFVVPIFKSGDCCNITNFRPIVIQSALAKVFEALVLDHLYFYLRKFISDSQHGFLRNRSTITNLLVFQEYVMAAFVDSCQVDCIYLDCSKAFDRVHHGLLIA